MASTFGARYQANQELEAKKADAERQHRKMRLLETVRGKQALWQTLQTILTDNQADKAISMSSYK
jgi:hypothetical protein